MFALQARQARGAFVQVREACAQAQALVAKNSWSETCVQDSEAWQKDEACVQICGLQKGETCEACLHPAEGQEVFALQIRQVHEALLQARIL